MTLEELRAEGRKLYSEVETFYVENSRKIDSLRASRDFVTISCRREELNRKQAEMLMANAKQFEALVETELRNRPDLEKLLRGYCADFLRTRHQMSETGRCFFR